MISAGAAFRLGAIEVETFDGQRPAESYGRRAADKIISVADGTHPAIRDQAREFKERIESVVTATVRAAVGEEREYCAASLEREGYPELARAIRR